MRAVRFLPPAGRREVGASSVEYGLIAAFIAAVIVVSVALLGTTTSATINEPCESFDANGVPCN